jgi:hypothetical protein
MTVQRIRDRVLKFNAGSPGGLVDRKPPSQPPRLSQEHRTALAATV